MRGSPPRRRGAGHGGSDDTCRARRKLRDGFRLIKLLPRIITDIQTLLTPSTNTEDPDPAPDRHSVDMVHLWDPKLGVLPAGVNYAGNT